MSLYDKASLVFSGKAAAGKDGTAYNIKPVEKLKVDELLDNPSDFSSGGPWNPSASITVANSVATFNGSGYMALYQNNIFEEGKVYKISLTAAIRKGQGIRVGTGQDSQDITGSNTPITTDGSHSFYFTGQGETNDHRIVIRAHNDSTAYDFDVSNFSVREVEQRANDFTFTRGSNLIATLEGADGLIKKGRENLFTYSNDFRRNAEPAPPPWGHSGLQSYSGPQQNPGNVPSAGKSGYDGSGDASFFIASTADSRHEITLSQTVNGVQTISIYAKAGGYNFLFIRTQSANNEAFFNLSTGSVGTTASEVVDAKMEDIGSGWHKCSMTVSGNFTSIAFGAAAQDNVKSFTGDGSSGIYIMDAQREMGLVATPYIDTTDSYSKKTAGVLENEPRYDYSGGDATLLLEPDRQNLIPHSEYFIFEGRTTITYNHGTSPEGFKNSTRYSNTTELGAHRTNTGNFNLTEGETYTASLFAKKGTLKKISFKLLAGNEADEGDDGTTLIGFDEAIFDLNDGSISGASTNASMVDYGNGWYRCIMTDSVAEVVTDARMYVYFREDDGTKSYTGATSENMEIYGAQVEKGSYATSYIPTYGSAATRSGDHAEIKDINAGTSYTVLFDFDATSNEDTNTILYFFFDDNDKASQSDAIFTPRWHASASENDSFRVYDQRGLAYMMGAFTSTTKKWVMRVDGTSFDLFRDNAGTPQKITGTALSGTRFLQKISIRPNRQLIKQLIIFDSALTDPECLSLTT